MILKRSNGPPSREPLPGATHGEDTNRRKTSRAGSTTRKKLLDAAEKLFADQGYDGTSLRDISEASDCHLALSTYHFGNKEQMFDEVIHRRAVQLEAQRLARLAKIDINAQSQSETVRQLIEAYCLPLVEARYSRTKGWQSYVCLMAGMINIKRWTPLIQKHFDPCGQVFVSTWRTVQPQAPLDSLLNAFSFMVVTTLYTCSYTDRFGVWKPSDRQSKRNNLAALTNDLIGFVHAGFMVLDQP